MSSIIMTHMNLFGRISVCGAIASYNAAMANPPLGKSSNARKTTILLFFLSY